MTWRVLVKSFKRHGERAVGRDRRVEEVENDNKPFSDGCRVRVRVCVEI